LQPAIKSHIAMAAHVYSAERVLVVERVLPLKLSTYHDAGLIHGPLLKTGLHLCLFAAFVVPVSRQLSLMF
jgi:hypothetical protein